MFEICLSTNLGDAVDEVTYDHNADDSTDSKERFHNFLLSSFIIPLDMVAMGPLGFEPRTVGL